MRLRGISIWALERSITKGTVLLRPGVGVPESRLAGRWASRCLFVVRRGSWAVARELVRCVRAPSRTLKEEEATRQATRHTSGQVRPHVRPRHDV